MELIGPHQVLGPLADFAPHGGQQLGGDGGVQNVVQHGGQLGVLAALVVGDEGHQVAHQGLGDAGVHRIHGHVIPVVGGPAQGQLGQVAGADDHAARLVGDVHEHLGALPGLAVLKGDGVVLHGLADVLEVDLHRLADVDALQGGPQALGQLHGVVPGAVGGAEAGHGHRDDVAGRPVQQLHGHGGDEDGQSGVQAAGQAHHGGLGPGVLQALGQAQGGDLQNLVAPLRPVPRVLRHEGVGGDIPGELGLAQLQLEIVGVGILSPGGEGGHAPALIGQPVHIDLADGEAGGKPPLRQQGAVFGNQVVAAEHQVGGGLPLSRVGVHIAARQPGGLARHQLPPVVGLAHHLVAGGQIQNQRGPLGAQACGGGIGDPKILTDLHPKDQIGHVAAEDLVGGKPHDLLPREFHGAVEEAAVRGGGEPPSLIELPVVGDVGLGHQTQDLSLVDDGGAVVELVVGPHRQAHGGHHIQVPSGLQNGLQALLGPPEQGVLEKQVPAGIAGEAQLGQAQHPHPLLVRLPHEGKYLFRVIAAVRHPDLGGAGRYLYKSVPHLEKPPLRSRFHNLYHTPTQVEKQPAYFRLSNRMSSPKKCRM